MDRAAIAKACGVEESWLDGWDGGLIGIYPVAESDVHAWTLELGGRTKTLTSLEASRMRYELDQLRVAYVGRPLLEDGP